MIHRALFSLGCDLVLDDVTSTFFEGQAEANDPAQRGCSSDHRSDCKQVNLRFHKPSGSGYLHGLALAFCNWTFFADCLRDDRYS